MKFTVLQEDLVKATNIASRFASSKVQLPVLANILLETSKNKLILSATNLEMSVAIGMGAKIEKEGSITVSAKSFHEIISNLEKGQIEFEVEKENISIKSSGFESQLSGMNSADYPKIPNTIPSDFIQIEGKVMIKTLQKILFSVSVDETRPVLTGVLFSFADDKAVLVSTDGFRLSKEEINLKLSIVDSFVLPKGTLSEMSRLLEESDNFKLSYQKKNNQIVFEVSNMVISSRVIEGNFPDYEKIIPQTSKIKINVGKQELVKAVKLASVFAKDSANVIKIKVTANNLEVYSESSKLGKQKKIIEARIVDDFGIGEDGFVIAFNYRFVEEFLSSLSSDDVEIIFNDPNAAGVFRSAKDKNFLHIIMPVRI